MSQGVEFDEEKQYAKPIQHDVGMPSIRPQELPSGSEPKMIQWLMRHGYARNSKLGYAVLIGVIVINAFITYFVVSHFM